MVIWAELYNALRAHLPPILARSSETDGVSVSKDLDDLISALAGALDNAISKGVEEQVERHETSSYYHGDN